MEHGCEPVDTTGVIAIRQSGHLSDRSLSTVDFVHICTSRVVQLTPNRQESHLRWGIGWGVGGGGGSGAEGAALAIEITGFLCSTVQS